MNPYLSDDDAPLSSFTKFPSSSTASSSKINPPNLSHFNQMPSKQFHSSVPSSEKLSSISSGNDPALEGIYARKQASESMANIGGSASKIETKGKKSKKFIFFSFFKKKTKNKDAIVEETKEEKILKQHKQRLEQERIKKEEFEKLKRQRDKERTRNINDFLPKERTPKFSPNSQRGGAYLPINNLNYQPHSNIGSPSMGSNNGRGDSLYSLNSFNGNYSQGYFSPVSARQSHISNSEMLSPGNLRPMTNYQNNSMVYPQHNFGYERRNSGYKQPQLIQPPKSNFNNGRASPKSQLNNYNQQRNKNTANSPRIISMYNGSNISDVRSRAF